MSLQDQPSFNAHILRIDEMDLPTQPFLRLYQVFPGNSSFFCAGRLISGPDTAVLAFTVLLILSSLGMWIAFGAREISPRIAFIIPGVLGVLILLGLLFRTAFTDPGIIPRRESTRNSNDQEHRDLPFCCNFPRILFFPP